jgi:hypothetical protein
MPEPLNTFGKSPKTVRFKQQDAKFASRKKPVVSVIRNASQIFLALIAQHTR